MSCLTRNDGDCQSPNNEDQKHDVPFCSILSSENQNRSARIDMTPTARQLYEEMKAKEASCNDVGTIVAIDGRLQTISVRTSEALSQLESALESGGTPLAYFTVTWKRPALALDKHGEVNTNIYPLVQPLDEITHERIQTAIREHLFSNESETALNTVKGANYKDNMEREGRDDSVDFRGLKLTGPLAFATGPDAPCIALDPTLEVRAGAAEMKRRDSICEAFTYKEMDPEARQHYITYRAGNSSPSYQFLRADFLVLEWCILIHWRFEDVLLTSLRRLLETLGSAADRCDLAAWITELLHFATHRWGPHRYLRFWDEAKLWPGLRWGQGALTYFLTNSMMAGRPISGDIAAKLASVGKRFDWGWSWWMVAPGKEFTETFTRLFDQRYPSGYLVKLTDRFRSTGSVLVPADRLVSFTYVPKHWETLRVCGEQNIPLRTVLRHVFPALDPSSDAHPDLRPLLELVADAQREMPRKW